jgi:hypothetical protein
MYMPNIQNDADINDRFQESWKRLSETIENGRGAGHQTKRAVRRLQRCLKWCIAYAFLRSYCEKVIQPYSDRPAMTVKKFWVEYWERNFITNQPPTAKDFFEWYCDSRTIKEEQAVQMLIL